MDEAELNAFLNMFMYGMGSALNELVDMRLVNIQLSRKLLTKEGRMFMQDAGIPVIEDTDVKTITEKYRDALKSKKITQYFEILEIDEEHAKLNIGQCIFAPSTKMFRDSGMKIVPCPIVTLLLGIIRKNTNLHGTVQDMVYIPETNSSVFTVEFKKV